MMPASAREWVQDRFGRRPPVLYGLVDRGLVADPDLAPLAGRLAREGVELVQLRAKDCPTGQFAELARAVKRELEVTGTPLILNDRVDVALVAGVDGVHLGAEDLTALSARSLLGEAAIIGVTAHTLEELAGVDPAAADYVGYGAVFGTETRAGASVCGPEALTVASARSTLPMVAIGGIRPDNVESLRGSGIAAVCAASALASGRTSPGAVESFLKVLRDW